MEGEVLEVSRMPKGRAEGDKLELVELTDLQLAGTGGGCAEVCPY